MTVLYGLFCLGIVVFVHELGHFLSAKLCGVAVESFSIGMGPILLHKTIGKTDYRLSLIPLGGYCGLKGQKDIQLEYSAANEAEHGCTLPPPPDSFFAVGPLKRAAIAFAGPFFNFLFAAAAFSITAGIGYTYYTADNRIIIAKEIYPDMQSVAADAGLQTGDRITAINGKEIKYFSDISNFISIHPEENISVTVDRNSSYFSVTVKPTLDKETGAGKIGVISWIDPVIAEVIPGSPADKAGLRASDRISAVNGESVRNTIDIQKQLANQTAVSVSYIRDSSMQNTNVLLISEKDSAANTDNPAEIGLLFEALKIHSAAYNFPSAIREGIKETANMFLISLKSMTLLFRGINITKAVSGPVRITFMLGTTAKAGFSEDFLTGLTAILRFLAMISISLFIMNLLPIPILDGGLILFSVIEAIFKKPIPGKVQYYIQYIGIAVLLLLFAAALSGDISYITKRSF